MQSALLTAALFLAVGPGPRKQAARLFDKGSEAYKAERFEEALADFGASYELVPLPQLLFDIAQCQRHLGHWKEAASSYQRYLEADPSAANGNHVAEYLADVRAKLEAGAEKTAAPKLASAAVAPPPSSAPIAATTTDSTSPARPIAAGVWWTGGVGAGLTAAGLATVIALAVQGAPGLCPSGIGSSCVSQTYPQAQTASTLTGLGAAGLAVGGALLAVAVIWAVVDHRHGPAAP